MDEHLKQLLALSREHYQKREYDKSEYLLRQIVAKTDRFADVFDMLGVIAHSRGDFVLAERYFEKAVALNPNYTEAQLNLMVTYNDLGKYDAARKIYESMRNRGRHEGVPADPFAKGKIANMHAQTAQGYQDAGMIPEAIIELEKAVALCPQFADLRTRLGVLLRDGGDPERARQQFEAAKEANPRYVQARVLLGVLLLSRGDNESAVQEFEQVLALDPENKSATMYLKIANAHPPKSPAPPAPAGVVDEEGSSS